MMVILLVELLKSLWSFKKYKKIKYSLKKYLNWVMFNEMASFAGWNTFGSICNVAKNQGVAIIMNYFFGSVINAAYGIANVVNSQIFSFSTSLLQAFNPQILKSEGSDNRLRMINLANSASKFSFLLLSLVSIPLLIQMPYILGIWLEEVPLNTVIFSRLIIVITLINQIGSGLPIILQAVGIIKWYQIVVSCLILLILPIGFLLLKKGYPAYSILVVSLCAEFAAFWARLYFAKLYAKLSLYNYFKNVIFRIIPPFLLAFTLTLIPYNFIDNELFKFIGVIITSTIVIAFISYQFSFCHNEKEKVLNLVRDLKNKLNIS